MIESMKALWKAGDREVRRMIVFFGTIIFLFGLGYWTAAAVAAFQGDFGGLIVGGAVMALIGLLRVGWLITGKIVKD